MIKCQHLVWNVIWMLTHTEMSPAVEMTILNRSQRSFRVYVCPCSSYVSLKTEDETERISNEQLNDTVYGYSSHSYIHNTHANGMARKMWNAILLFIICFWTPHNEYHLNKKSWVLLVLVKSQNTFDLMMLRVTKAKCERNLSVI